MFGKMNPFSIIAPAVLVLMCVMAGCATSPEPKKIASDQDMEYFEHTVCWPGENFSLVARWYTGDYRNWTVLAEENPSLKPAAIRLGDKILIPRKLMTNMDPMPRSFIKAQVDRSKRSRTQQSDNELERPKADNLSQERAPQATPDEPTQAGYEPELFGPKE